MVFSSSVVRGALFAELAAGFAAAGFGFAADGFGFAGAGFGAAAVCACKIIDTIAGRITRSG
jgi:hypothetical protein